MKICFFKSKVMTLKKYQNKFVYTYKYFNIIKILFL